MLGRMFIAAVLALSLSGCITVYEYGADTDSDDVYYSEPSIDRYDYGYSGGFGPYYDRYYDPYYDSFGYRRYGGWSGSIGYRFGDGAFGRYGFPYWYFGYGYGYGRGYSYDAYWPYRYYSHGGNHHRPPSYRPPHNRAPGEHRRPYDNERETPTRRRIQDVGRPVPEISTAPRVLNGSMPRARPRPETPQSVSRPQVVLVPSSQGGGSAPRAEAPPPPRPAPMPARRFEQNQDAPAFRPNPAPAPERRANAPEREARPEPK